MQIFATSVLIIKSHVFLRKNNNESENKFYARIICLTIYEYFNDINTILGKDLNNELISVLKNKTKGKFILLSIASVAVLWLLQQIPYIGGYVSIFTVVFGLGIFVYSLFTKKALEEVKE